MIMTSNLGAREMSELISGGIGFAPGKGSKSPNDTEVDQKIYRTAVEAARRKFSPEFMNRIDKVVVFRSLKEHHLRQILDLELQAVQDRIMQSAGTKFVFQCSETAKDMLLKEGLDFKYGARHLKRAVERFLVYPLSNLVATGQIGLGDLVHVDVDGVRNRLIFSKSSGGALIHEMAESPTAPRIQVNHYRVVLGCRSRRLRKPLRRDTGEERKPKTSNRFLAADKRGFTQIGFLLCNLRLSAANFFESFVCDFGEERIRCGRCGFQSCGTADGSPIRPSERAASRRTSEGSFSLFKAEIRAAVPARLLI